MAENRNKKRRIAHIGNMTNALGTTNLPCDDELAQADCDLVKNILQSMEKSQNAMSYQKLQENRIKDKAISQTNGLNMNSFRKRNNKSHRNLKQNKKIIPEKSFPLMAKCQKSMKYLKKNRCVPKPRAHVGSLRGLFPIATSNFKSNNNYVSSSTAKIAERPKSIKKYSKKSYRSPDLKVKHKGKIPLSSDSLSDEETFQTQSFEKETRLSGDTDSDNEYEKFLQKHHSEKFSASYNNADTPRKKKKRRKKQLKNETNNSKVINKKLSDFEKSAERECNNNNLKTDEIEDSCRRQFPSRKFRRIVEHSDSDDSATDIYFNDSGILNCDSSSSTGDEKLVKKSTDKENVMDTTDLDDSERLGAPNSTNLFELKNTLRYNELKLRCLKPCWVLLKRDPALKQKAALLQTDNSSGTNVAPIPKLDDDDDCCIISETSTRDLINQESRNIKQLVEHRDRSQRKSAAVSESFVSGALTELDGTQDKSMCTGKLKDSDCKFIKQTDTYSLISNQKSAKNLFEYKSVEVQDNEKILKRVDTTHISTDIATDESSVVNKITKSSHKNVNSFECVDKRATSMKSLTKYTSDLSKDKTRDSLNCNKPTCTAKEIFNVQILSVKSLNDSDVIILSDDEEKDSKTIPAMSVTNEKVTEDNDVEIICLDSIIGDKKKSVNENVKDSLENEIHTKVDTGLKENSSSSSAQPIILDDDCIILDDVDLPVEKLTVKNRDEIQPISHGTLITDDVKTEKENSNKCETTIADIKIDTGNKILKILETIDFNCIKKVLNDSAIAATLEIKKSESISTKSEDKLCGVNQTLVEDRTVDSFPKKQNESYPISSHKRTLIQEVTPVGYSANNKSLETSIVTREHNFVNSSDVPHKIIKNSSENMQDSVKLNISSRTECDESFAFLNSSSDRVAPKLIGINQICKEEIMPSNHKTEQDILFHLRKNQQMLPVYPKMQSCESPFDELDIIAAKSIQNLDEPENKTILPLLDLYQTEYDKFLEIKCTEQNITEGLKLLQEQQAKKLMHISSSIKNLVKNDGCFHKVNNEFRNNQSEHKNFIKSSLVNKESLDEKKLLEDIKPLTSGNYCDIEKDDKIRISHPSMVENVSEVVNSKTIGPSSSQEVYNRCVCAECGKRAKFACHGCAKIYFCSEKCGVSYWSKGHHATCER